MQLSQEATRLTDLQEEETAIEKEVATLESQVVFSFYNRQSESKALLWPNRLPQ